MQERHDSGFVPAFIRPPSVRRRAVRWAALSGDPAGHCRTDRAGPRDLSAEESLARWIRHAQERVQFQRSPSPHLLARVRRALQMDLAIQLAGSEGKGSRARS